MYTKQWTRDKLYYASQPCKMSKILYMTPINPRNHLLLDRVALSSKWSPEFLLNIHFVVTLSYFVY